jgi:hypothetical protein
LLHVLIDTHLQLHFFLWFSPGIYILSLEKSTMKSLVVDLTDCRLELVGVVLRTFHKKGFACCVLQSGVPVILHINGWY